MDFLTYKANGKLLLTGEYFILDGASGIGLPCRFGQNLKFSIVENNCLEWESRNLEGVWFTAKFNPDNFDIIESSENTIATTLQKLLKLAASKNKDLILKNRKVITQLFFNNDWGLGSSSTLVVLVAKLFDCNPFELQFEIFGGSGYDIACGVVDHPIIYSVTKQQPSITKIAFNKTFFNDLYFIYLNQKQNSRVAIELYKSKSSLNNKKIIKKITDISTKIEATIDKKSFCKLLKQHEKLVGNYIEIQPIQERLFSDFKGQIKSLGAWGGDFILAVSDLSKEATFKYFNQKGYPTILTYSEMVFREILFEDVL